MAIKNLYIYRESLEELKDLQEQYKTLGRYTRLEEGRLVVFAIAPKKEKKTEKHKRSR